MGRAPAKACGAEGSADSRSFVAATHGAYPARAAPSAGPTSGARSGARDAHRDLFLNFVDHAPTRARLRSDVWCAKRSTAPSGPPPAASSQPRVPAPRRPRLPSRTAPGGDRLRSRRLRAQGDPARAIAEETRLGRCTTAAPHSAEAVDYPDFAAAVGARGGERAAARCGIVVDAAGIGSDDGGQQGAGRALRGVPRRRHRAQQPRAQRRRTCSRSARRSVHRGRGDPHGEAVPQPRRSPAGGTSAACRRSWRSSSAALTGRARDRCRLTPRAIVKRLPKTDIHCHLDGCLRPRTMLELAEAQGVKLPTAQLAELTRLLAGRQAHAQPRRLPADLRPHAQRDAGARRALPRRLRAGRGRGGRRTCGTSRCATRRSSTASSGSRATSIVEPVIAGLRGRRARSTA